MTLTWVAVEQSTGRVIADLPGLSAGTLKQTIGRYESTTAVLPIPTAPDDWQRATRPGYAALIALDGDVPLWGGLVTQRKRGADADGGYTASLGLVTAEGYFDTRYVGDWTYTATDQSVIAADLAARWAAGVDGLQLVLDYTVSGVNRDRTYRDDEDATLYTRLTQLMGVIGGPEFTVGWQWLHSPERLVPVFRCATRLGAAPLAGLGPNASFELPGSISQVETVEDYSAGKGANDVMAVGSSQGDARPQSPHQFGPADGRPKREFRWSPSSSIIITDTLTAHAQRAVAVLQDGSNAITLTANRADAPRLGIDWGLGDDVAYDIDHPAWPDGLSGVGRAIGWELDDTTVSPILAVTTIENGGSG